MERDVFLGDEMTQLHMVVPKGILKSCLAATVITIVLPAQALGYIDPDVGSYVIQVIIALALGVTFTLKIWWKRIKGVFRCLLKNNDHEKRN